MERDAEDSQPALVSAAQVRSAASAIDRGDLIEAYTICSEAIAAGDAGEALRYLQVLSLARMGDTAEALRCYQAHDLAASADIDPKALRARLFKDAAFAASVTERAPLLALAADAYAAIADANGGYFPLINAATLALLAGDLPRAAERAQAVLADPEVAAGRGYWPNVTQAEAHVILARHDAAATSIRRALLQDDCSDGARSTTIGQFRRIADAGAGDAGSLDALIILLQPGPVAHFCGHIFASDTIVEARLIEKIDALIAETGVRIGYGAAAAGADILFAERLLAIGGEAHVVLPFDRDDFIAQSVDPAGAAWRARFDRLLGQATSVRHASAMRFVGDDGQFEYGSRVAMGLARLRAAHRASRTLQIALWDGQDHPSAAGTSGNIRTWQETGGTTLSIDPGPLRRPLAAAAPRALAEGEPGRVNHGILFTDFQGFSRIPEPHLPVFWTEILGRAGRIVDRYAGSVLSRNSWGDAIFAVVRDATVAVELALELQAELRKVEARTLGLTQCGMRIALHFGPVYRALDPITGVLNFFGTEISRAARLEPVTPPNSVYATEPFAAALEMCSPGRFDLHYAGTLVLAKGYGAFPIYRVSGSR